MTTFCHHDGTGRLTLGASVGRGGEGEVFALADGTDRALKIYDQPDAAREAKIRAMVAADLSHTCPNVAFPQAVAFDSDGSFVGFTMPLVSNCHPIHELSSPSSRRRVFPAADWRFLTRTALNVARAFRSVHSAGAVVGDVNGSGMLVSNQAVVTMIDADSFQWGEEHLCRVGVPEFTPPELQGQSLDGVVRTIDHDGFGLAIMIFQLLFLGRHPFAGVPIGRTVQLAQAITKGEFAYSAIRDGKLAPPPGTLLLTDLPLGLRNLFERAFAIGMGERPKAAEWADELEHLETNIAPCTFNQRHVLPRPVAQCPWCRIERLTGTAAFGDAVPSDLSLPPSYSAPAIVRVAESTLLRAAAYAGSSLQPIFDEVGISRPSAEAHEFFGSPRHAWTNAPAASSYFRIRDRTFEERYLAAKRHYGTRLARWQDHVGATQAAHAAALLAQELSEYRALLDLQARQVAAVPARLRATAIKHELAAVLITDATISGVGRRRLDAIAHAGIPSAADIDKRALLSMKGISAKRAAAVLLWRDMLAVETGRRVAVPVDEVAVGTKLVQQQHAERLRKHERQLDQLIQTVEQALNAVTRNGRQPDHKLQVAHHAFAQAAFDLHYLGFPIPPGRVDQPAKCNAIPVLPRAKPNRTQRAKVVSCPKCGGTMVRRLSRTGMLAGNPFLGCIKFPACPGIRPLRAAKP